MLRASPMLAGGGGLARLLPQNVFATSLYAGGAGQTITNGLDLAGSGGLVWLKVRDNNQPLSDHGWYDNLRNLALLSSNKTAAEAAAVAGSDVTSFNSSGFSLGTAGNAFINGSGSNYASWSFVRKPKFFDVVTYTGDGTIGRQIPHKLGITPGMIIIKARSATGSWAVWHRAIGASGGLSLNSTGATSTDQTTAFAVSATDALSFTLLGSGTVSATWNAPSGVTYVAYLFAHDPDTTTGIVQCVSSANSGGQNFVALPWQPQFVLSKRTDGPSDWFINDVTRGFPTSGGTPTLLADTTAAEDSSAMRVTSVGPTGCYFQPVSSGAYIHLAIRAPILNLPLRPQDAFATSLYTGTGANQTITNGLNLAGSGGLVWRKNRTASQASLLVDSSRGATLVLTAESTVAEATVSSQDFYATGFLVGGNVLNTSTNNYASWSFVRKPKFFDVVTYTGDGTTGRQIAHSLGIVPGMILVKRRNTAAGWAVWHNALSAGQSLQLNSTSAVVTDNTNINFPSVPNATTFTVGGAATVNNPGDTYVAYLFAHDPDTVNGIIQCGSFVTNSGGGGSVALGWQPQFLLFKCATASFDWWMVDTTRGVAGNDYVLRPNTSGAETTTWDLAEVSSSGFTIPGGVMPGSIPHIYLAIRAPTT